MSKRIFTNKIESPLAAQYSKAPLCYYHKYPITNFCVKKKCTLPLCDQCLHIHQKQHINNKQIPNQGIIDYEIARDDALKAFQQRRQEIFQIQENFKAKIIQYKGKMLEIINLVLDRCCEDSLITDGNLEILSEIEERTNEIKRGSLKQLIRYYQDTYGAQHFRKLYKMYSGDYLTNFKFELDQKSLQKLCRQGIKDLNINNQKLQQTIKNKLSIQQKNISVIPSKGKTEQIKNLDKNNSKTTIDNKKNNNQQKCIVNSKNIINEQQQESQITSYQLLKSKRKNQIENIYTNPSRFTENSWNAPSQNTSQASKTSKSKKKGLSVTKSYKDIGNISQERFHPIKTQVSQKQKFIQYANRNDRKSNWRDFVNMRQTHPDKDTNEITQPITVLNPKQMRQLIAKKKIQQKQRQLKGNKSAEFLVPHRC